MNKRFKSVLMQSGKKETSCAFKGQQWEFHTYAKPPNPKRWVRCHSNGNWLDGRGRSASEHNLSAPKDPKTQLIYWSRLGKPKELALFCSWGYSKTTDMDQDDQGYWCSQGITQPILAIHGHPRPSWGPRQGTSGRHRESQVFNQTSVLRLVRWNSPGQGNWKWRKS